MHMWFSEYHTSNVRLDVRIEEQLFSGQSDYQKIDVFKSCLLYTSDAADD